MPSPIVGSGSLFLRGQEDHRSLAYEIYENITGSNISLHQLALLADMTASADDPMSEFYNYQSLAAPETVTTSAASSIGSTTATMNGSVTSTGGVTSRGFKYMSGNQSQATVEASGTEVTSGNGDGSFSSGLSGLSSNQTYTFVAWAENAAGRTYGSKLTFGTLPTYTYTVTQNTYVGRQNTYWQSALGPATRTATVAQGQTANADFTIGRQVGFCFTNNPSNTTIQAQGPYNSINFTNANSYNSPSTNWGWAVQKSGMNSNASMTLNSNFPSPQQSQFHNAPADKQCSAHAFGTAICYGYGAYYNSSTDKDGGLGEQHFLLNNPSNPDVFNNHQNVATSRFISPWQMSTSGDPGTWDTAIVFTINNPYVAGVHTSFGNYQSAAFRFKGVANYYPGS